MRCHYWQFLFAQRTCITGFVGIHCVARVVREFKEAFEGWMGFPQSGVLSVDERWFGQFAVPAAFGVSIMVVAASVAVFNEIAAVVPDALHLSVFVLRHPMYDGEGVLKERRDFVCLHL
jgi:ABC-type phosphate transport system permease subunit